MGIHWVYMGVSKDSGTLKWMVKIMEKTPLKWDDLGKTPIFWKHPYIPFKGLRLPKGVLGVVIFLNFSPLFKIPQGFVSRRWMLKRWGTSRLVAFASSLWVFAFVVFLLFEPVEVLGVANDSFR